MSAIAPILNNLRIIPRESEFLNRKLGSRGEIFYDRDSNSLRLYDGRIAGGISLAKADLTNVDLESFRAKSVDAKLATVIYTVTVSGPQSPDTGNKYNLNSVYRLEPNFVVGYTYVFDQDDATNVYWPNATGTTANPHPLNFSSDNLSGELGDGTSYLDDVRYFLNGASVTQAVYNGAAFNTATSRQVQLTVTNATPAVLYYWCYNHQAMGAAIAVADPGSGSGGVADIEAGTGIEVALNGDTTIISNTGVLSILAGSGALVTNEQGVYTVSVNEVTGDLTFNENTVNLSTGNEIVFVPDVTLQSDLVFSDGSRQNTATPPGADGVGIATAAIADDELIITLTDTTVLNLGSVVGSEGPAGASGEGAGDVVTVGAPVTSRAIVRYSGTSGNNIQESLASVSDTGTIAALAFSGNGSLITDLNATNLTSGTVPNARFPATLPAASGANLTALNATNLSSGTVPVLRLGTAGTRDATTFLRGDNTWAVVAGGSGTETDTLATVTGRGATTATAVSITNTTASTTTATGALTVTGGVGVGGAIFAGGNITSNGSIMLLDAGAFAVGSFVAKGGGTSTELNNQYGALQFADSEFTNKGFIQSRSVNATNSKLDFLVLGNGNFKKPLVLDGSTVTIELPTVASSTTTGALVVTGGVGIGGALYAGNIFSNGVQVGAGGATAFTGLGDSADLTVDRFYLPAITMLAVSNIGASSYRFDQYGTADNPTVYAINGTTIAFNLNVSGHPFLIQNSAGTNYSVGLIHVSTAGTVSTGASAQGQTSGTLYWKIPTDISGGYRYQCSLHAPMVGSITIKTFATI